ncbi:MAG: hypothetical protein JSV52_05090 [Candidatus Zixiibacteriota bacterium]|nr:MAG: hypothetical protein JSV52_05090 [candidate division Zixibacteria bacterium]
MKYVLYFSLGLWVLSFCSYAEAQGPAGDGQSHTVEDAGQAVNLALLYTGLDEYENLLFPPADEITERTTVRAFILTDLADSVNGRDVWQVSFNNLRLSTDGIVIQDSEDAFDVDVTIDCATGALIQIRSKNRVAGKLPRAVIEQFDEEARRNSAFRQTFHGFPDQKPKISLLEAMTLTICGTFRDHLVLAYYVLESHTFRGRHPVTPVWAIQCMSADTIVHEEQNSGARTKLRGSRSVIDALKGEVLLDLWWHDGSN